MATISPDVMKDVKDKLDITWDNDATNARLQVVVGMVSPRLASLLGYEANHEFSSADGEAYGLFINGCFYEFSNAWDDFVNNYEREIQSVRLHNLAAGDEDAEAQG